MSGIDLLQELKNMEQHITATLKNDKESEFKNMEERLTNNLKQTIDNSMKEAIQTLTTESAKLVSNNPVVQKNTGWEWLIRSHSSARFCFELSGNLN